MPGKAALSSRGTRRYIIMRIYAFDVARVCVARVCGWRKKEENKNVIVEGKRQSVRWKMRNAREREKESEGGRDARMRDRLLGDGSGCCAAGGGASSPREPRKMEINYIYT